MSSLGKEVALDNRLLVGNANQVVELGCNQNIQRRFPATQTSSQSIQWNNILSLGQFALLDPRFVVEYDVEVTFDIAQGQILPGLLVTAPAAMAAATVVIDPTPNIIKSSIATGLNVPNICFAEFPLSRCTSTISLMINSVETNTNLQNLLALNREWIVDAHQRSELTSSCPNSLTVSPVLPDQVVFDQITNPAAAVVSIVPNQPNTHMSASKYQSRASFVPKPTSISNVGSVFKVVYQFREPVFASPLTTKNAPALANVQSIQLKYNIDTSSGLQGMLSASNQFVKAAGANDVKLSLAGLSCSLNSGTGATGVQQAQLYIDVLSVDEALTGKIPEICYYDYHYLEYNNSPLALADNAILTAVPATLNTNGYKLTTMPKYYYLRIMPQINGTVATNTLAGFQIDQITIQLGALGTYTLLREQLWQCFKNNTGYLDLSFGQWEQMGCPICLNMSVDVSSSQGIFQGIQGTGGLMFSVAVNYNARNYLQTGAPLFSAITGATVAGQFYAYECFVQAGSVAIGQGSCNFRSTTMSENEFLVATERGMISNKAVQTSAGDSGGSFFGSLRGVLNSVHHVAKGAAQALQHPMVQKGLSAIAGSGMSGGSVVQGRRSRK